MAWQLAERLGRVLEHEARAARDAARRLGAMRWNRVRAEPVQFTARFTVEVVRLAADEALAGPLELVRGTRRHRAAGSLLVRAALDALPVLAPMRRFARMVVLASNALEHASASSRDALPSRAVFESMSDGAGRVNDRRGPGRTGS